MDLHGKNAVVTGASRGLGVFIAETLARKGCRLALAARSADELDSVTGKIQAMGARAVGIPTDVSDPAALENLVTRANAEIGPIDVLINNAGIEKYSDFINYDFETIEKIMKVNVISAQWLTKLVVPQMIDRGSGHIVNIASVAGKTAVPYNVIYSSSKHALVGFSWSLREELKAKGVGVSVVCPGFVSDAGMFNDWSGGKKPPSTSRAVTPQQVADATVKAIEEDKAEIIVARGLAKIVDVFHAISPGFTTSIARRSGAYKFLAKAKDAHFRS
jgi:short-subunit dehydrogenase